MEKVAEKKIEERIRMISLQHKIHRTICIISGIVGQVSYRVQYFVIGLMHVKDVNILNLARDKEQ